MKKLIAISVIFALVTGAAFAQASIGAEVFTKFGVSGGGQAGWIDDDDDPLTPDVLDPNFTDKATTHFAVPRARLSASGQNEAGTIGASIRYNAAAWGAANSSAGAVEAFGWAWWKPIDQIRLQIGSNGGDGEFGLEGLTGWGFEALAYELGFGSAPWAGFDFGGGIGFNRRLVFYSGWNAPGAWVQVTPVEGFAINVGLPFDYRLAEDLFDDAHIQASYNLDGVGLFGVTYKGEGADVDGTIYVFADLALVDGLGLNVGFSYYLETKDMGVGVAAQYDVTDEFGFKASLVAMIPDAIDYAILVDLLPYYKISDTLTGFCSVSICTFDGDSALSWMVNPYLKVSTGWAQDLYAGVKFGSTNDADASWDFIVGMTVGF